MSLYQINSLEINWKSEDSYLLFNDRHGKKKLFTSYIPQLPHLKSHVWLATSGRVYQKWVALSKKALLTSAEAVNQHLDVTSKDRWALPLPLFHVGGLSILARAYLSRGACFTYNERWSAETFLAFLKKHKITLSSLVPTQVYDLVKARLSCPPSVRAIVVGGENLSQSLYKAARELNWPLLPSYGLTECSSQVATAEINSLDKKEYPSLRILPHVQTKMVQGEIVVKSKSLMSGFVPLLPSFKGEFQDPKKEAWFFTGDKGQLQGNFLQMKNSNQIKILGEKINLKNLEEALMDIVLKKSQVNGRCFLLPVPSEREGFQLALVSDVFDRQALSELIKEFNEQVSPFEKIQQFYFVSELPLTGISKVSKPALLKILGFSPENPT